MRLCEILLLSVSSAALRVNTDRADGKRIFTVTITATGPPHNTDAVSILTNSAFQAEMECGTPTVLTGKEEGEEIGVGIATDNTSCTYTVGQKLTTCFLENWKVTFASQEEVEQKINLNLSVERTLPGIGPPFEVKIDNVTQWTESGPIDQGQTWWRLHQVAGAGVMVTVLFPETKEECAYTIASEFDQKMCTVQGWKTEFETVISQDYTGDWSEVTKANTAGYMVHIEIQGSGPSYEIIVDNDQQYTVGPFSDSTSRINFFDMEIGETLRFVFDNSTTDEPVYSYRVGDEKQSFHNLKGYTIDMETIPQTDHTH